MNKLKDRAKKLKTDIPAVFLALKDKRTPWYAKILAAVIVVYALSPIDLIPDFIPMLGYRYLLKNKKFLYNSNNTIM